MTSELQVAKALLATAKEKISVIELKEMEEGLRFNIFRILDRFDDEEKGHSAFIAELLNPKGKHGRGNLFLNIFFDNLKEELKDELSTDKFNRCFSNEIHNFLVDTEKSTTNGRIDILIRSDKLTIAIENKIYAEDQLEQLERYKKFLNSFYAENILIYLTLYGDEPSNSSKGKLNAEDYHCIPYEFIVNWLKCCIKMCKTVHINKVIEQYIQCVETLTGKTGTTMTNELSNLLTEPNNLDAAIKLSKSINRVKTVILQNFLCELNFQINNYVIKANVKNLNTTLKVEENLYFKPDKIAQYFTKKSRRPKSFGYAVKVSKNNTSIANFEIRIHSKLYMGVWADDGTDNLNKNIIDKYLDLIESRLGSKENLDTTKKGKIIIRFNNAINFREFDEQCIKFTDINEIKTYISKILINVFCPYIELFIESLDANS